MIKNILGLDLGTNSIGWALIDIDHTNGIVKIIGLGSRILPMDAGEIKDFEGLGKIKSSAAQRTEKRGPRRVNERYKLRRDRLHLVLNLLESLPNHYKVEIDFTRNDEKCGQFKSGVEPNIAYKAISNKKSKYEFLFKDSYQEMLTNIGIPDKKGSRIPFDWTLYYLRQKALTDKISLEELAWVLLSYNHKRGYEKLEVESKSEKENEISEEFDLQVKSVQEAVDKDGKKFFKIELDGLKSFTYDEYSDIQMTFENDLKEVKIVSKVDNQGNIEDGKTLYTIVDIYSLTIGEVKYENDNGKHKYHLMYNNGWEQSKDTVKYTFRFENAKDKSYEYVVETIYNSNGKITPVLGKPRKLREPDFSDKSNDWTLLKKKTEKEALEFNTQNDWIDKETKEIKKFISPKIFAVLKNDALNGTQTKIIGGMFQTIERDFYREELKQIVSTQRKHYESLNDKSLFEQCVKMLYPKNKAHSKTLLENKDAIQHLLIEDILLYQRPLKSKKSEIADCKYEIKYWKEVLDKEGKIIEEINIQTGEVSSKKDAIRHKVVSVSHPYFQEFRIWDKIHNLRLIQLEQDVDGKKKTNVDVTKEIITDGLYQSLFTLLNNQKSLSQAKFIDLLKPTFKDKKLDFKNFVWNFPEDDEIKGNETRVSFAIRFKRCGFANYTSFLTQQKELELWHYLYSVSYKERTEKDKKSLNSFFTTFFKGYEIDSEIKENLIKDFANFPKFASNYCAYSEKTIKKILPHIRLANNDFSYAWESEDWYIKWNDKLTERKNEIIRRLKSVDFSAETIDYTHVIDNLAPIPFPKGLFNSFRDFDAIEEFKNLDLTKASYLVYGRHSELEKAKYWISPDQIRRELHSELKQHSLNNPIAEKVILEMMQLVADIWDYYGEGVEKFFTEIHLEVGRELKKSAKEKEKITNNQKANKVQNNRLRQVLEEFLSSSQYNAIPQNNDHYERLKIVEEAAEFTKNKDKQFFEGKSYTKKDIDDILKKSKITKEDFDKYKLWIEQGYKSPYTNRMIKLTDLFDGTKYNVDHIFPQASVTNDSLSNKVVCEREVNQEKSNKTAREFITNPSSQSVYCLAHNAKVEIIDDATFTDLVKSQFSGTKRDILLSKEIPKGFTSSQLNNARHIARKAMELLSHIVREPGEVEFRSKNVLPVTGEVTTKLKRAWKLDEVWKELLAPRFIRMNELTKSNLFGSWQISKSGQKYFDCNLDESIREKNEAYDIKRIDHRHHALDALIVALCTKDHVDYISNINANAKSENYGKQKQIEKYRETLKKKIKFSKPDKENPNNKNWFYMLPGEFRTDDAENSSREYVQQMNYIFKNQFGSDYKSMVLIALESAIATFKQNLRVINKSVNIYKNSPNTFKTQDIDKGQNLNWSIRRSLGKGTMYGKIDIGERINKQLIKNAEYFYNNPESIIDIDLRNKILEIIERSSSLKIFTDILKDNFKNKAVECIDYKAVSRYNSTVDISFSNERIKTISDKGIQNILNNHLEKFDTIKLSFEEGIKDFEFLLEKNELKEIISKETDLHSISDLIVFLQNNKYKYKKNDYSMVNLFIDDYGKIDYRADEYKDKIEDHPEIAFTSELLVEMNKPEILKELNNGKNHKPIRKVRTYTSFGGEKRISNNKFSNKYKQFVKVDKGTNFYLAVYEIHDQSKISATNKKRVFKEINLFDLIDYQKQTNSNALPIEQIIYNDNQEKYNFLFTLTQNDLVKFTSDQKELLFAFNRFTGTDIYFRPINHSSEIEKSEVDLKINSRTEKLGGSQVNETTSYNGEQIKNMCIKLKVDRLGNISKA